MLIGYALYLNFLYGIVFWGYQIIDYYIGNSEDAFEVWYSVIDYKLIRKFCEKLELDWSLCLLFITFTACEILFTDIFVLMVVLTRYSIKLLWLFMVIGSHYYQVWPGLYVYVDESKCANDDLKALIFRASGPYFSLISSWRHALSCGGRHCHSTAISIGLCFRGTRNCKMQKRGQILLGEISEELLPTDIYGHGDLRYLSYLSRR